MTNSLEVCSYLSPERVLSLQEGEKQEVLELLADLIAEDPLVKDPIEMKKAIMAREKVMSTGIGNYVAIPHARCAGVDDFVVAFARIEVGMEFDSVDKKPVHLVFMIVANEHQDKKYIKLLSRLMLRMRKEQLIERLMQTNNAEDLYRILVESK
ncbi:MAG: PTS sugar transporter subunit IIA [Candidatus Cloacimonadaceae bacterium]|jgi:mannitol/fructose-specific phosphotransferase system IIA component (Ntr-type)|nr:PTS sugar transporter subunit IIA [Candidatus Cloacimonadota bacterium]MCK9434503.1 PTS sugar transporter subunit IIA [Candidatus Cloacimonadota bacterium]MDD2718414.1 PTS sugar transporter subunit IIA [Candidatus Cloacimonadota bacterium]MDD3546897.1 PTS sugar transporter subunit IIA [Candidatus Cloacimonadota bacterium]MDD4789991.1 PTS sugar transporter subunit IIA [Candidatus Cloacimonadota bacterium]